MEMVFILLVMPAYPTPILLLTPKEKGRCIILKFYVVNIPLAVVG